MAKIKKTNQEREDNIIIYGKFGIRATYSRENKRYDIQIAQISQFKTREEIPILMLPEEYVEKFIQTNTAEQTKERMDNYEPIYNHHLKKMGISHEVFVLMLARMRIRDLEKKIISISHLLPVNAGGD